jgi:subtilisin family serine protease
VHAVATGAGVKIGVIDTGAEFTHPALVGHLESLPSGLELTSEETCDGIDNDGDGTPDEACGHGTFVSAEVAMCAPGATIVPVRVLNSDGVGSMIDVLHGIRLAVDAGCEVINLSLCLSETSEQFNDVLDELDGLNVAVVAAAGNAGMRHPLFPGTSPYLLGVGATGNDDHIATFSGAGWRIDLAAPGVSVQSAMFGGNTGNASGTSMAVPIVSSAIALVMERRGISAFAAASHLRAHTRPIIPATATQFGCLELWGAVFAP